MPNRPLTLGDLRRLIGHMPDSTLLMLDAEHDVTDCYITNNYNGRYNRRAVIFRVDQSIARHSDLATMFRAEEVDWETRSPETSPELQRWIEETPIETDPDYDPGERLRKRLEKRRS